MSETNNPAGNALGIRDVLKGALRAAPEMLHLDKGLLRMVGLRPSSRQSIGKVIEYWAKTAPDQIALMYDDQRWTHAEFNAWANRIADVLRAQGVSSGDSVGILMENRPEVLACVAAAAKLGAIAGMLNFNQRGDVQRHSIGLLKTRVLVISAECHEALQSCDYTPEKEPDTVFLWHEGDERCAPPSGYLDLRESLEHASGQNPQSTGEVRAEQPCFYIFTSGTTGLPKASIMTHYRWLSSMGGLGGLTMRIRADDIFYCCLPLYHNNALTVSWASTLAAGAAIAIDRKFSASRFWDRIRFYDATAFCYIGELLRYLLNQKPSPADRDHRIRLITGNGLRPEIWAEFEKRFGIERIYEFYGASESNIAFINAFGVSQTAGFTPMKFAIVEFDNENEEPVRDDKGHMKKVSKGGVGLLISEISKSRPFDGYTDPSAGAKKLFRDVFKKGDTWFNSGDLVRDQGMRHIQFVDRVGDTFRWKGENVATGELEGVMANLPDLEHGVAYGVQVPGCDGRAGMIAITLREGKNLNGKSLAEQMTAALPAYAVPLFIRVRPAQETTGTFKYRKVELKQEGFDPARIDEPLYILLDKQKGYEPITEDILKGLNDGTYRL